MDGSDHLVLLVQNPVVFTCLRVVQVLLNNMPEATTALLMQLCTPGDSSKPDGDWIAKVSDFAHLAADR